MADARKHREGARKRRCAGEQVAASGNWAQSYQEFSERLSRTQLRTILPAGEEAGVLIHQLPALTV